MIKMAAADRNYSEVEINPESSGYGEQSTIQDPTTPEGKLFVLHPTGDTRNIFVGYPRAREDTSEQQRRNGAAKWPRNFSYKLIASTTKYGG